MSKSTAALKASLLGIQDSPLDPLLDRPYMPRTFDPDAWHVMNERDNSLIRDQVLHGYTSRDFIYSFDIKGTKVTGISVVGARELASQYGGIKARIMATVEKRGSMFIFRQFSPMSIDTRTIRDLADDVDFYECIMEISDIKTGNSIEVRKKELRYERTRKGDVYERPHFDVIAESKAYRNGVLAILPQNVISEFEGRCVNSGNESKEKTIDQLRDGIIAFATKNGVSINRKAVIGLGYAEIVGLGGTAKDAKQFKEAASALGIVAESEQPQEEESKQQADTKSTRKQAVDKETGEIKPQQTNVAPDALTYAQVAERLQKATEIDLLDVAADFIGMVPDAEQRSELAKMYTARRIELSN